MACDGLRWPAMACDGLRRLALIACSLALVGPVVAQTARATYLIDQNFVSPSNQTTAPPSGWVHDPRFIGMPKVNVASGVVDADPVIAANKVMDQIRDRLNPPPPGLPTLEAGNIPVVIAGFAHCMQPGGQINPDLRTCLHHNTDAIVAGPGQPSLTWPFDPTAPANKQLVFKFAHVHPWMTLSRVRLKYWMEDFMAQVFLRHVNDGIPLPTRFAFDSEDQLTGCCDVAWSHQMANFRKDARWFTDAVPGFGLTMEVLYQQAEAQYGWDFFDGDPQDSCRPAFSTTLLPSVPINRPVPRWMYEVLRVAKAAIMEECAYATIRTWYQINSKPQPDTSNYAEFIADGQPDTFGWFLDKNIRFGPSAPFCQTNEAAGFDYSTRSWIRAYVDPYNEGARYGRTFLDGADQPQARWAAIPTTSWATCDGPQLYDWKYSPSPLYTHRQVNLYRPGWPLETDSETALRLNQHRLESIQYSSAPHRAPKPEPYILMPDQCGTFGLYPDERHTTLTLAMLRRQQISRVLPFTASAPQLSKWQALRRCDDRAYAFAITGVTPWFTSASGESLPGGEDLFYSARENGAPMESWFQSTVSGSASIASVVVDFSALSAAAPDPLQLHIECRVTDVNGASHASLGGVRGDLYFWDWTASGGGAWSVVHINDDGNGTTHYRFHTLDRSMRRGFDVSLADTGRFVSGSGHIKAMLRWEATVADISTLPGNQFTVWIDAVQALRITPPVLTYDCDGAAPPPASPPGECEECFAASPETTGPDVNFDGRVDAGDISELMGGYSASAPSADYNGDGTVDGADVADFVQDFSGVSP
ncbi:MAG: hypothetical protein JNK25_11145 [Phycisphaerae bacterium]|nr:hypothetical protein [Phycisphaerae bacterium]